MSDPVDMINFQSKNVWYFVIKIFDGKKEEKVWNHF